MEHLQYVATVLAAGQIAAAIAVLTGVFVPVGQGNIAAKAIESMARQPEARSSIQSTLFIGCALAETSGLYGLIISILLLFANPFVNRIVAMIADLS